MFKREQALDRLDAGVPVGYTADGTGRSELAAMALGAFGRIESMHRAARWLKDRQGPDGRVGVSASNARPCWPTGVAVLSWLAAHRAVGKPGIDGPYAGAIARGLDWVLRIRGTTLPAGSGASAAIGQSERSNRSLRDLP